MTKGISIPDLERMMGKKADHVSGYVFDPDTGSFERRITFSLSKPKRKKTTSSKGGRRDDR